MFTVATTFSGTISTSTTFPYLSYATSFTSSTVFTPALGSTILSTSTRAFTVATFSRLCSAPLIITSSLFKRGHSKTGAKNPDGFTRAVIDLSLLGRCDYLVLTAHSTFSVMARSLSRNESESFVMPSRGYA